MHNEQTGCVLVVEDERDLRFILLAHLRAAGFDTLEASTALIGIELASTKIPDVIIMDIGLPVMDGIAATRALKRDDRTAAIPIIMLTGWSRSEDVVRGLEAGAQEYVCKPIDFPELLARVRTAYKLSQTRQDLDRLNERLEAEVGIKTKRLQLLYDFMRDLSQADSRDGMLNLITRCVQSVTQARRISLLLKDADGEHLVCAKAVGIDPDIIERIRIHATEGISGQVYQSGKTLAAKAFGSSTEGQPEYASDAFLSTPLVTRLESGVGILGVLNVTDKEDDAAFSDEEIECVRSIADAGAIALDNFTRHSRMQQSVRVLLRTVGHLAEYRDEETTLHLERVSTMARILGEALHREGEYASVVTEEFVESLVQAAPMHDIGKVGTPDDILMKPGALTDEEFQIMKMHTEIGRRVLSNALDPTYPVPLLQMCVDIAYAHHERYDGKGYPRRIAGVEIPLAARIIAVVDAYDAITSARRYKKARSHAEATAAIREDSGTHFDPVIVEAFMRCHERFDEVRHLHGDVIEPADPVSA